MSLTLTALIGSITVFVLAIFLGFELISKVPPTLHTPLMSGANAISGITIVGALILSNATFNGMDTSFAAILAFLALIMATINVVGGFMVTNRMLEMIAGKKRKGVTNCFDPVVWDIGYLLSASMFIVGIKRLSSPGRLPRGIGSVLKECYSPLLLHY